MSAHISYRSPGESDAKPRQSVEITLPDTHLGIVALITDYLKFAMDQDSKRQYAPRVFMGELLQNELERWFEEVTGMRLGNYLAKIAQGMSFEWHRRRDGQLYLVEKGQVLQ